MKSKEVKRTFEKLRELIDDNDSAMNLVDDLESEFNDLEDDVTDAEDEATNEERRANEAESALRNLEDAEPAWKEIDCGIGKIQYTVDNLMLERELHDAVSFIRHKHTGSSVLY